MTVDSWLHILLIIITIAKYLLCASQPMCATDKTTCISVWHEMFLSMETNTFHSLLQNRHVQYKNNVCCYNVKYLLNVSRLFVLVFFNIQKPVRLTFTTTGTRFSKSLWFTNIVEYMLIQLTWTNQSILNFFLYLHEPIPVCWKDYCLFYVLVKFYYWNRFIKLPVAIWS